MYRTIPEVKLFSNAKIQNMLIRILFIWTLRHPASGYVQGINDLAAPFILVFLAEYVYECSNPLNIYDFSEKDLDEISPENLACAEGDVYWCLSKVIDNIQDNYTENQPGVHKVLNKMKRIINREHIEVNDHLE